MSLDYSVSLSEDESEIDIPMPHAVNIMQTGSCGSSDDENNFTRKADELGLCCPTQPVKKRAKVVDPSATSESSRGKDRNQRRDQEGLFSPSPPLYVPANWDNFLHRLEIHARSFL